MKNKGDLVLSLDTSNYTTSIAVVSKHEELFVDKRKIINVKEGEKGLRQSYALFQHFENIPILIGETYPIINTHAICGVAVSDRPRPAKDSYMPVFNAGVNFGKVIAYSLDIPLLTFSHQEGHLAAATYNSTLTMDDNYLAFHLSGGTCELLLIKDDSIKRIGKSKDITFGQVLDRLGVSMGFAFPSGMEMDRIAFQQLINSKNNRLLTPISLNKLDINLSGFETQAQRILVNNEMKKEELIDNVFYEISMCLIKWIKKAAVQTECNKILFSGGVTASQYLRRMINEYFTDKNIVTVFGQASLSTDNAVGIGLLGAKKLWQ